MSELDDLIQRIRERSLHQSEAKSLVHDVAPRNHSVELPATITATGLGSVNAQDVIAQYYQWILRRPVDPFGFTNYQEELRAGLPPWGIAFNLRYSAEGRQVALPVHGLYWARLLWLGARLTRPMKVGVHRLFWWGLRIVSERAQVRAQQALLMPVTLTQNVMRDVQALQERLYHLTQRYEHTAVALQTASQELARSHEDLQIAHQLLQAKQHQHLLQVDASAVPAPVSLPVDLQAAIDAYYLAFEDAHRGPSAEIQTGLNDYEQIVQEMPVGDLPALDLGCGRGEWLLWLQERGIAASGVDGNPVMVQHCQARGLTVHHADLLQHLQSLPDRSVRLVSSFHVIEHLPFEVLFLMMREIHRVLVPGGLMILETPNPENILVGSHTFHHDFSHRAPITPTSIEFLAQYHGFVGTQILRRNPYPVTARVIGSDPLTERVNGHLCGPQDFALIARTPVRG